MTPVWLVTLDRRVIQLGHSRPQHNAADLDRVKSVWAAFARSIGHRVDYVAICSEPPPVPGGRRPIRLPESTDNLETLNPDNVRSIKNA